MALKAYFSIQFVGPNDFKFVLYYRVLLFFKAAILKCLSISIGTYEMRVLGVNEIFKNNTMTVLDISLNEDSADLIN